MVDIDGTEEQSSAQWQSYKYEGLAQLRVDCLKRAGAGGRKSVESGEEGAGGQWAMVGGEVVYGQWAVDH